MTNDPRDLVRRAYLTAQERGKSDWYRMTLAVLKNRLLDLTGRQFNEADYGVANFGEFIRQMPDLLVLDLNVFPPMAEIKWGREANEKANLPEVGYPEKKTDGESELIYEGNRIRSDLWTAIVDYRSGKLYVWDPSRRCVRIDEEGVEEDVLPTLDEEELYRWRNQFAEEHLELLSSTSRRRLENWCDRGHDIRELPGHLRSAWKEYFKRGVAERLKAWFKGEYRIAERLDQYREKGDNLGAGEVYAQQMCHVKPNDRERLFVNIVIHWASSTPVSADMQSIDTLIDHLEHFVPAQISVSLVQAVARIAKDHQVPPSGVGDLVYRLSNSLREAYDLPERMRSQNLMDAAVSKTEEAFSGLTEAVQGFKRATALTAKRPSIEVVRHAHRYLPYSLQGERSLLREIEVLLGPLFRKFCESCERHAAEDVPRRAKELRHHMQRFENWFEDDTAHRLWISVFYPVVEHVSRLIEEGTQASDELTTPEVAVVGGVFKLDLRDTEGGATFPARIQNLGEGPAYGIHLSIIEKEAAFRLRVTEPREKFDLGAGDERLITLHLAVPEDIQTLPLDIQWTCANANGRTCEFKQLLQFVQQNIQPNWEDLRKNPPYGINPIRNKKNLYGRDSILLELEHHVSNETSTFLWGQKRVGKTSVLQVLASEISRREDLECIVLRIGELASLHEGQIAHTIASRIVTGLNLSVEIPQEDHFGAGLGRLIPFVEQIKNNFPEKKLLLIIDEFDDLDPAFYTGERGKQFVKALRSLSEVGLTFMFVGSERMDSIYRAHAADLNKWVNCSLDRITSESDCIALISEPIDGAIEFDNSAVRQIVDYCKGNPFYMHLLANAIFLRCWQERRTFVGGSDVEHIRRDLLRTLGPTNFAHFWEDVPVLKPEIKRYTIVKNCLYFACISCLNGRYEGVDDLLEAQEGLELPSSDRLTRGDFRETESHLFQRGVVTRTKDNEGHIEIELPVFRDWVNENGESQLLPTWKLFQSQVQRKLDEKTAEIQLYVEAGAFPISEDELLSVSEKLIYLGKQKDVAEVRRWLRQFDDDNRIEVAFSLLKRLVEKGFVNEGASVNNLGKMKECIQARRLDLGNGSWQIVRRRLDNLCISYVDSETKSGAATARELAKRMNPGKCGSLNDIRAWVPGHIERDPLLVVVDDFAGTGNTLNSGLERLFMENAKVLNKLGREGRILCCLQTAFPEAVQLLESEFPDVRVLVMETFGDEVRAFEPGGDIFADEGERIFAQEALLQVCRQLSPQNPLGYGDMGALVAFHNTIPNNTLPAFWSSGTVNDRSWEALLPRASFS